MTKNILAAIVAGITLLASFLFFNNDDTNQSKKDIKTNSNKIVFYNPSNQYYSVAYVRYRKDITDKDGYKHLTRLNFSPFYYSVVLNTYQFKFSDKELIDGDEVKKLLRNLLDDEIVEHIVLLPHHEKKNERGEYNEAGILLIGFVVNIDKHENLNQVMHIFNNIDAVPVKISGHMTVRFNENKYSIEQAENYFKKHDCVKWVMRNIYYPVIKHE